ncbi:MAG: pitrilysin family protein [Erysipelotrichaceae bacterium]
MEKIINNKINETYYIETLDNGLRVIIWYKPLFANNICCFGTNFGAFDLHQKVDNVDKRWLSGTAHFLEHKMFEDDNYVDILNAFTDMGALANAFTSYKQTVYYFSTPNKDYRNCLNLLLDFVQQLKVSEQSIEKEKGIILSEHRMYKQDVDSVLNNEVFRSLYHYHPCIYDISGSEEDISSTTKEQLEDIYQVNYHPKNMILSIVTNNDPNEVLNTIKENQKDKIFVALEDIITVFDEEVEGVKEQYHQVKMDVASPKIAYNVKLQPISDRVKQEKYDWMMNMLMSEYFSPNSDVFQQWLDDQVINNSFYSYSILESNMFFLTFRCDMISGDFAKKMEEQILNMKANGLDYQTIVRYQKKYLGKIISYLNTLEQLALGTMFAHFEGFNYFSDLEIIESIKEEDFAELLELIDVKNYSIVEIV